MAIRFYLDPRVDSYGDNMIRISWSCRGVRVQTTIGYGISSEKVDTESRRFSVKRGYNNGRGVPYNYINSRIDALYHDLNEYEIELSRTPSEVPDREVMRKKIADSIGRHTADHQNSTIYPALIRFISEEGQQKHWAENTKKKFGTLKHHLEAYDQNLRFSQVDEEMLHDYLKSLSDKGITDTTLRKEVKLLRWFLRWASKKGYHHNLAIDDFQPRIKDSRKPVIFLTADELQRLIEFQIPENGTELKLRDVSGKEYTITTSNKASLEKVRDFFEFCCFTSLRYSDLHNLKQTDIYDDKIHIVTIKTDDPLVIELSPQSKAILDKYSGSTYNGYALPVMTEQKMNVYLKQLGEMCGLTSPVTIVQYKDGHRVSSTFAKWQKLTTHAGRRTFISLALAAGISPVIVMKWTGHSDYNSMRPYIEISEKTKASSMKMLSKMLIPD